MEGNPRATLQYIYTIRVYTSQLSEDYSIVVELYTMVGSETSTRAGGEDAVAYCSHEYQELVVCKDTSSIHMRSVANNYQLELSFLHAAVTAAYGGKRDGLLR